MYIFSEFHLANIDIGIKAKNIINNDIFAFGIESSNPINSKNKITPPIIEAESPTDDKNKCFILM